jgi:hypothetical protein
VVRETDEQETMKETHKEQIERRTAKQNKTYQEIGE